MSNRRRNQVTTLNPIIFPFLRIVFFFFSPGKVRYKQSWTVLQIIINLVKTKFVLFTIKVSKGLDTRTQVLNLS